MKAMEQVCWKMLMDSASWFLRIPKPWTTGSGVATERCGPDKNCWFWGNRTPPVTGLLLPQECTTISKKGIFPGPVHLNYLLRQNTQSPSHISGKIVTANRWNLCQTAELRDIRQCTETTITKILWSFISYFCFSFSLNIYKRVLQDDRIIHFRASGLSDMIEAECKTQDK